MRNDLDLEKKLFNLIAAWESETVEFKRATSKFSTEDIGKYFSALANEANLKGVSSAWLIFGVDNKTHEIVGTSFREEKHHLMSIKHQIAQLAGGVSFKNVEEVFISTKSSDNEVKLSKKRVIMFEIPSAPNGNPISSNGHFFARQGESLVALDDIKKDTIRAQIAGTVDWTAQPVEGATITDLDKAALRFGKDKYIQKTKWVAEGNDIDLSDEAFLKRVRLMSVDGKITRAAILLLGTEDSASLIDPHPSEITWRLMGENTAFEHFYPPFLLNVSKVYERIRIFQQRLIPKDKMVKVEVPNYTKSSILEVLNNCIAHQDYSKNGRIVVSEYSNRLVFENAGKFFEKHALDYFVDDRVVALHYRNNCLARAMVHLDMIERVGFGLRQVFYSQADRYLPLPDYEETEDSVIATIYGSPIDNNYTELMTQKFDFSARELVALDNIQKGKSVDDKILQKLRKRGFIDKYGQIVPLSKDDSDDGINDNEMRRKIFELIAQLNGVSRSEIEKVALPYIEELGNDAKTRKINATLVALKRAGKIKNIGSRKGAKWVQA